MAMTSSNSGFRSTSIPSGKKFESQWKPNKCAIGLTNPQLQMPFKAAQYQIYKLINMNMTIL